MLKKIEELTGKRILDMFDMICGTSTGAVLAALIGFKKHPLDRCEVMYKAFARKVFFVGSEPGKEDDDQVSSSAWARIVNYTNMLKVSIRALFFSFSFFFFSFSFSFS